MKKKEFDIYNICYVFSGGYEHVAAVSILSMCQNNRKHKLHFHIMSYEMSNKKKKVLRDLIRTNNQEVSFYNIDRFLNGVDSDFDTHGWHPIVLARLKIGEYLPKNIKRVLYLDGDTLVLNDIRNLYEMDLAENIIAMSAEPIINLERIQFLELENTPYCNSGVILIDLDKWRHEKAGEKIFDYYIKNHEKLFAPDQDAIMGVMKKSIKIIEPRYNFSDYYYDYPYSFFEKRLYPIPYFDRDIYEDCKKNPVIVHFIGECKPWRAKSPHPFVKQYDYYSNQITITPPKQKGWELYYLCWNIFNFFIHPFPSLRLYIINSLIPVVRKAICIKISPHYFPNKEKNMKHSFVVLAYKESKYLEECIRSCQKQKASSKVIIATTTDNTYIRDLARKYKLEMIVGKHTNIGGDFDFARNASDTELVTIAHQDDIYEPDYAKKIIEAYKKYPKASIVFSDYYELRNEKKVSNNINLKIKRILLFPAFIKHNLRGNFFKRWIIRFGNSICCPAVTFVNKNCPKDIFASDFSCNVDWNAWEKLSKGTGSFVFVPEKLMGHRISEESTTTEIINNGVRTKEDFEMFSRFWNKKIAKALTRFYKKSEKSNRL